MFMLIMSHVPTINMLLLKPVKYRDCFNTTITCIVNKTADIVSLFYFYLLWLVWPFLFVCHSLSHVGVNSIGVCVFKYDHFSFTTFPSELIFHIAKGIVYYQRNFIITLWSVMMIETQPISMPLSSQQVHYVNVCALFILNITPTHLNHIDIHMNISNCTNPQLTARWLTAINTMQNQFCGVAWIFSFSLWWCLLRNAQLCGAFVLCFLFAWKCVEETAELSVI